MVRGPDGSLVAARPEFPSEAPPRVRPVVKVSVGLPRPIEGAEYAAAQALEDIVVAIERAGLHGCHVSDHPCPVVDADGRPRHVLDPFLTLAYITRATSRLVLHTNLVILPYRNPLLTASMVATLQHLAGGRLVLGVGAGYLASEAAALGSHYGKRNDLVEEAIGVLTEVWSGAPLSRGGLHWTASGNSIVHFPGDPRPPVWMGGNSRAAMNRAVRFCEGWIPAETPGSSATRMSTASISTIDELHGKICQLHAMRTDQGRTGPFEICFHRDAHWLSSPPDVLMRDMHAMHDAGVTWVAGRFDTGGMRSRRELLDRIAIVGELLHGFSVPQSGVGPGRPS